MIRNNFKKVILFSATIFPFNWDDADVVSKDLKTVREADLSKVREETGWERLRQIFRKDEFGRIAPEVHSIIQVACMSSFIGAMYGGFMHSRDAYLDFMKNNQATVFRDHLEAKKKLQDQVTVSFAKGAFKWGWRLTFFCSTYVTVSTSLATYWGKNGILEHTIAGAVAGTVYKFKLGPRAWVVGGGLGLVLGTIAGAGTSALLSLTGMTMEEVRYWNYKWVQARSDSFDQEFKKHLEKEQMQILTERDSRLENSANTGDYLEDVEISDKNKNK